MHLCVFKREVHMDRIIVTSEDDLKRLLKEIVGELIQSGKNPYPQQNKAEEELVTSLLHISKIFRCSLPTAQKIKNSIPKEQYAQIGKRFAIRKSVLLSHWPKP